MKLLPRLFLLAGLAVASAAHATPPPAPIQLEVSVTGSLNFEMDNDIASLTVNAKAIYADFGVNKAKKPDYDLVYDIPSRSILLRPILSTSGLPDITVLTFAAPNAALTNAKNGAGRELSTVSAPSATGPLLQGLTGWSHNFSMHDQRSFVLNVHAYQPPAQGQTVSDAIFDLKFTTGKAFKQVVPKMTGT